MNLLTYTEEKNIATIMFSRPESLNAINSSMFEELNQVLDQIETSRSIRCVILTGQGKAFVAGADIAEMKGKSEEQAKTFSSLGQQTLERIENMPVPFIGVINGFALGGGLEIALACDFLIASEKAKFSAPEVNLGLIPGFGGTQRLARAIGLNNARYYLFSASMFDAHQAMQMGLVQAVFPPEELLSKAHELAILLNSKGSLACQALKSVINTGLQYGSKTGFQTECDVFAGLFNKAEAQEGMNAFIEKRKPNW
ncbi:enoyl-CoA hydratase/isomerase family protein [Carboxylicivirga sp. RSCT41]|uniref:enoyl-CoA hydratase/isomerase family protein n=1 Tax=Carboxylicivirga agarovorans TaxID=3417570 RepID=UPI003D32C0BC